MDGGAGGVARVVKIPAAAVHLPTAGVKVVRQPDVANDPKTNCIPTHKGIRAMINETALQGNWNEIKGSLRKRWGQLSNDDVQEFDGNVDRLVGMIQRKTGTGRQEVERYLGEISSQASSTISNAAEGARQYVQQAAEGIYEGSQQAMEAIQEGYEDVEEFVRQRPSESLAASFGIGLLVGLLVGASLRSR